MSMKTISLKTLLGTITPLHWKPSYFGWKRIRGGNKPVADCQSHEDAMYIIHACNHFPELVETAKSVDGYLASQGYSTQHPRRAKLQAALASAETVQIEE